MKSLPLNKTIRQDILDSVMDKWKETNIEPDKEAAEHKFADWLYKRHFGKYEDALKAIPAKFLKTTDKVAYSFQGTVKHIHMSEDRPRCWDRYSTRVLEIFDKEIKQLKEYHSTLDKHKEWRVQYNELKRESRIVIDSANTSKQLLEIWPEIEPFLPAYLVSPEKAIRLPSIPISRLNERLGIK